MRSSLEIVNVWQDHAAGPVAYSSLDRRSEVVVGEGLVLTRDANAGYALHAFVDGEMRHIGSYDSTAEAWQAIDQIDAGEIAPRDTRRYGWRR